MKPKNGKGPRVEHNSVAEAEAHILMYEPEFTLNTGNVQKREDSEEPETI